MIALVSLTERDAQDFRRIVALRYQVISTRDIAEAREVITKHHPEIVVCDSEASGLESWRDLLAMPGCESFALIVVSRHTDDRLWAEILNLGGHDVLTMPLRRQKVEWSIRPLFGTYVPSNSLPFGTRLAVDSARSEGNPTSNANSAPNFDHK